MASAARDGPAWPVHPPPTDGCYLVCSDGLTHAVPTEPLTQIPHAHQDGRAAVQLSKAAIAQGRPDNITLAAARVAGEDEPPQPPDE